MNYTNQTQFLFDENFLFKIGSSWALDSVYALIISPCGLIGFVLNLIAFATLLNIKIKESKLYDYLKLYSFSSACICIILSLTLFGHSPKYFRDFTHPIVKFYRCRIFGYLMMCLFFFNNLLDIFVSLDRISIFTTKISFYRKVNPYKLGLFLSIASLTLNSPLVFGFDIMTDEAFFTSNEITYCEQNKFGKSRIGLIINMIVIIIRDILTLILEILASLIIVYYYKRYWKNRSFIHIHFNSEFGPNSNSNSNSAKKDSTIRQNLKKGKKILLMTLILSLLSIITHLIVAIAYVFIVNLIFDNRALFYSIRCFATFSLLVKNFSNIFIFYHFNSNFQKKLFKLKKQIKNKLKCFLNDL